MTYAIAGYVVVFGTLLVYAVSLVLRGRKAASSVLAQETRHATKVRE
jgi:hypothetical protein